jgi:alkanesulfonate monooxygenase SsuD/methylene tetrahydromethanopterin reductase-like flavin-dependent oxidoreductase (luciferase family)
MQLGLALPQYDYSVAGERPLQFETIAGYAETARISGFDSVWLSDHLFLDLAKYGGPPDREACYEPVLTLAALARRVPDVRLGALVFCEALRPASVLAKALGTLDRVSNGRLDVGLGAGWYEPEYDAIGMAMPSPGVRIARLTEAISVVTGVLGDTPFTFDGEYHRASGARSMPTPVQQPRPRVFVGGKGNRLLRLIAERADGWNTCWTWTTDAYRERLAVLDRACEEVGRDPSTVWRSLGLYTLCGENEPDLARRFERMAEEAPPGVMRGVDLAAFRAGRLVGTIEQVREQAGEWGALGVETLIAGVGAVPFHVARRDDVELLGHALMST